MVEQWLGPFETFSEAKKNAFVKVKQDINNFKKCIRTLENTVEDIKKQKRKDFDFKSKGVLNKIIEGGRMRKIKITTEQLQELDDTYSGVCLECGEINFGNTEPDAENYKCNSCGKNKVMGSHWIPFEKRIHLV